MMGMGWEELVDGTRAGGSIHLLAVARVHANLRESCSSHARSIGAVPCNTRGCHRRLLVVVVVVSVCVDPVPSELPYGRRHVQV